MARMNPEMRHNREQLMRFARTALPPLLARYAVPVLRTAMAFPAVRAVGAVVLGIIAVMVLTPAVVVGLITWFASNSATAALVAGAAVLVVCGLVAAWMAARVWRRWRQWRKRNGW